MIRLLPPLYLRRQACVHGSKKNSLAYNIWGAGWGSIAYV